MKQFAFSKAPKIGKKAISAILSVALIAIAALPLGNSIPKAKAEGLNEKADYISAKYNGVSKGHVFESVTYERLLRILRTDGNHIVVLSSPGNESSQAALKHINQTAKDYGVKTIYHFDPHLAQGTGVSGLDITLPDSQNNTTYNKLWTTAKTYTATNGAQLKYIDKNYTSDDTDLFVFNRKAGGSEVVDSPETILSELLIKNGDEVTDNPDAFKAEVENVFSAAGPKGYPEASSQSQYDFFKSAVASTPTIDASIAKVAGATKDDFPAVEITYSELLWLLDQPGQRNFLVAGTWCGDTRAAFGYIVENAIRFAKGTPLYVFDFRFDGNLAKASAQGIGANETAEVKNGSGYVMNLINEKLGPHKTGINNAFRQYYPNGDTSLALATHINTNFRSPYLFKYNKDAEKKTFDEWVHELHDYEKPWGKTINGSAYDAVNGGSGEAGDYLDYELATGGLPANITARGRAEIGSFFNGKLKSGHKTTINASNDPSDEDNGCGDDNDVLNNIGEDVLIPNHGTYDYDVENYDIHIEYVPSESNPLEAFKGKAIVTGVVKTRLNEISLDFRQQVLTEEPTVKIVPTGTTAPIQEGSAVPVTSVKRINEDELDKQKINLRLGSWLEEGDTFQVTIEYTTGFVDDFVASAQSPQGFQKSLYGNGGAALGEPVGAIYWFPANDAPHDAATYKISLTAPSAYAAISNGKLTSNTNNSPVSGKRTRIFTVSQPTATYQIVAAFNSDDSQFSQNITLLDGTEIPFLAQYPTDLYNENSNRARDKIDSFYNKTPYYIQELEKIIGKYPSESAGFIFGNLSNGHGEPATFGAIETKDRPYFTNTNVTSEFVFVHEYTHQWFGNAVRLDEWKSLWLNEGFATYVTDLFYERTEGFNTQQKYKTLYDAHNASHQLWKVAPANIQKETDLFGGAAWAYNRGALALSVLRVLVGDEAFFSILPRWVSENSGKTASTQGFLNLAEEISNVDLTEYANVWLYGTTKPEAFPAKQLPEKGAKPSAPVILNTTDTSLTVSAESGLEYSINGEAWVTGVESVTFSGLLPNQEYTVKNRFAGISGTLPNEVKATTLKTTIGNTVQIKGSYVFGSTLSVDLNTLLPKDKHNNLSLEWKINGETKGNGITYVLNNADYIGKLVSVTVTASGDYKGTASGTGAQVAKTEADSAPAGITGVSPSSADGKGHLSGIPTDGKRYDIYRKTGTEFTEAVGENLTAVQALELQLAPGEYGVRYAGSTTHNPSLFLAVTVSAYSENHVYSIALSESGNYAFPSVSVGYETLSAKSIKISNTGNQSTGELALALSGTDSTSFTLSKSSVASIAQGGSTTFTVKPNPGLSAGSYTANVTVTGSHGISAGFTVSFKVEAVSAPKPTDYRIISEFADFKGTGDRAVKIDADLNKFVRLTLNGAVVASEHYTVAEGSTIITLKEAYLKTLSIGDYSFVAEFTDGSANISLNIDSPSGAKDEEIPQTGDTEYTFWMIFGAAAVLAIAFSTGKLRRKNVIK